MNVQSHKEWTGLSSQFVHHFKKQDQDIQDQKRTKIIITEILLILAVSRTLRPNPMLQASIRAWPKPNRSFKFSSLTIISSRISLILSDQCYLYLWFLIFTYCQTRILPSQSIKKKNWNKYNHHAWWQLINEACSMKHINY